MRLLLVLGPFFHCHNALSNLFNISAIYPSKIEWDLTNGPRSVSCNRAIRSSGFFRVRSVAPVGQISWNIYTPPELWVFWGGGFTVSVWVFPKIGGTREHPQNGWFMEKPIKIDDLGVPLFFGNTRASSESTQNRRGFRSILGNFLPCCVFQSYGYIPWFYWRLPFQIMVTFHNHGWLPFKK